MNVMANSAPILNVFAFLMIMLYLLLYEHRFHLLIFAPEHVDVHDKLADHPGGESGDHDPEDDVTESLDALHHPRRHVHDLELDELLGECGRPVDEAGKDGHGIEAANMDALYDLGRERAD